jgi:hypothetical protein
LELEKIVQLFSSKQLPDLGAKALISSPAKPSSKWTLGKPAPNAPCRDSLSLGTTGFLLGLFVMGAPPLAWKSLYKERRP